MPTRKEELETLLDDLDAAIMAKYPEEIHDWLHYAIAQKVKLELELAKAK